MTTHHLSPPPGAAGQRLDVYVAAELAVPRAQVQAWCGQDLVAVDGAARPKQYRLRPGDTVTVCVPDPVACEARPQDIPLDIVYEDDDLLVVDKPQGLVVHPAPGHSDGTLVNALLAHCGDSLSGIGGTLRPGIVHRIDKDTSGLLIVAKTDAAHRGLAAQIAAHSFVRAYEAVVVGRLRDDAGVIDAPLGRHPTDRKRMAVRRAAVGGRVRDAVTRYAVLARYAGYTHVRLELETGRTHQIRVHMASIGHPVAGDPVYGKALARLPGGQCLHAREIGFVHPRTGQWLAFTSPLPPYFTAFLRSLGPAEAWD